MVVYLVLNLQRYRADLHWYLRQLEKAIADVLSALGLEGQLSPGLTGLWVEGRKVASIGVGCRRWITQHGFALNVSCSLEGFSKVVPCGIKGCSMGSLVKWLPGVTVNDVQPIMKDSISKNFNLLLHKTDNFSFAE